MSAELPLPDDELEQTMQQILKEDALEQLSDKSHLGRFRDNLRYQFQESTDQSYIFWDQLHLFHRFAEIREELLTEKEVGQANQSALRRLKKELKDEPASPKTKLQRESFFRRLSEISNKDADEAP